MRASLLTRTEDITGCLVIMEVCLAASMLIMVQCRQELTGIDALDQLNVGSTHLIDFVL